MLEDSGHVERAEKAVATMPETDAGHLEVAITACTTASASVATFVELQASRLFYIRAQQRLILSGKSLARRYLGFDPNTKDEKLNARASQIVDAALSGKSVAEVPALAADLAVLANAIAPLTAARKEIEKQMKRAARTLPVYPWAKAVKGLGDLGLAVVVAEAGDLGAYPKKGHLWKRLGLAPYEGKALSTWRGVKNGLSAEQWIEAGYKPTRRAEIHACVSDPLFRAQSVASGPYRAIYDRRKAVTQGSHPDWTPMHHHRDALRIMTKHLIRDLWVAWRQANPAEPPVAHSPLPAASPSPPEVPCPSP